MEGFYINIFLKTALSFLLEKIGIGQKLLTSSKLRTSDF